MRILIDIGHPAHVHFFRNAIRELEGRGHEVRVTARDKEVALELLKAYGIPYEDRGSAGPGMFNKAMNMIRTDWKLLKIARKFKPDVMCGILNPYTAQVSRLVGAKSITFTDTEHARSAQRFTFPFTNAIVTPQAYLLDHGKKHIRYEGTHEMAYLHPKYFTPDVSVLQEIGIKPNEKFAFLRTVAWGASHDRKSDAPETSIFEWVRQHLDGKMRIITSNEISGLNTSTKFDPSKALDILAHCNIFIGDSATMAAEAALLGTNSIYISNLKGRIGVFDYMEKVAPHYKLIKPDIAHLKLAMSEIEANDFKRHNRVACEDVTQIIVDQIMNMGEIHE
jgi:predicted glycosyltransferase